MGARGGRRTGVEVVRGKAVGTTCGNPTKCFVLSPHIAIARHILPLRGGGGCCGGGGGGCLQVRLLLLAAMAGEHILLIGPPGTAKSEVGRRLNRLVAGSYFERLLTRFSVPEVRAGARARARARCGWVGGWVGGGAVHPGHWPWPGRLDSVCASGPCCCVPAASGQGGLGVVVLLLLKRDGPGCTRSREGGGCSPRQKPQPTTTCHPRPQTTHQLPRRHLWLRPNGRPKPPLAPPPRCLFPPRSCLGLCPCVRWRRTST